MYCLCNLIYFSSFASLSSSSCFSFFFLLIFSIASCKPFSLIILFFSSSSSYCYFFKCLFCSFSFLLFSLASSIIDAVLYRSCCTFSFLSRLSCLFFSVSYSIYLFWNSILSLNSAIDISSRSPWPPASVGSNPLVLTIGIFSSSLICLISSYLFLCSCSSSSLLRLRASVISLFIWFLNSLFSWIIA